MVPLGSIHCCSANCFPRRVSKTLDLSQRGTAASVHCWLSGNGNTVSKGERKLMSDRADVEQNNCLAFEGQDAMSAITFSSPGTCTVVRWPAWVQYSIIARSHRRLPGVGDFDFDAILSTQLTVGVLSHSVLSGVCLEVLCSNATPTAGTSAASSKSKLVSRPFGVSTKTTSCAMSAENSSLQTTGGLSQKCCRHVSDMLSRHKMSLQFWPDWSMSPTQDLRCRGLLCRLQPTLIFPAKTQVHM